MHPEDRHRVKQHRSNVTEASEIEYRIVRSDETVRWIRYRSFPISNEQGEIYRVAGIAEDITLKRQSEDHRLALVTEQERVKVLRDFISDASHDLRSPLTAMNLKIDLLEITKDETAQKQHLDDLRSQIRRFSQLIDNLFTLSRLESNTSEVYELIEPGMLLADIHRQLLPVAHAKNQQLLLDIGLQELPRIMAHYEDLSRAITNLVGNAIKYTPESGVILVQASTEDARVFIKISDTGIGIDEEELPLVFSRFFRATTAKNAKISGTGLGLAIVKAVIERHQGTISVTSKRDHGTMFTISLPIV